MNYLQITVETALLTAQLRLRSIDSESHSLSSESKLESELESPATRARPRSIRTVSSD
jgi:hypothetical protein